MPLITQKLILRSDLRANPDRLYVFGDNLLRRGYRGQAAEMRGEPNAVGITTKKIPSMLPDAFFTDSDQDHDLFVSQNSKDATRLIEAHLCGRTIVWPEDGIGTGLAQLQQRAPRIMGLIDALYEALSRDA